MTHDHLFGRRAEHIKWESGRPETAACECPHCKTLIDERNKPAMVTAGAWRVTHPEVKGQPRLVSPR
jgi:hypothetical protein